MGEAREIAGLREAGGLGGGARTCFPMLHALLDVLPPPCWMSPCSPLTCKSTRKHALVI